MSLPQSKVTAQGQISVPAEVRKKLGVGPGSVLEWHESDGGVVVRRAGVSVPPMSTTRDFPQGAPKGKSVPYVTHGHADHFFGFAPLLERLPHAKAIATPELVTAMRAQLVPDSIDGFWHRLFPGETLERLLVAEPLEGGQLDLEGHTLVILNAGRTDNVRFTCLYAPSVGLTVQGMSSAAAFTLIFGRLTSRAARNGLQRSTGSRS